jgi:multidrug efflux pump
MRLSEICVKRPVLSTVLSLILVILGLVTWKQLQLAQYPQIDQPVVSVTVEYRGASPDIIETQITKLLEQTFAGIEGVDFMESTSEGDQSKVNIYFKSSRDIDGAANDVRDRLGTIQLPPETAKPTVSKTDADSAPIIYLSFSSQTTPTSDLYDYADRFLKHDLEAIAGVASVQVSGGGESVMRVFLDPIRMAAYNVTAADVVSVIKRQNLDKPGGRLTSNDKEFSVSTEGKLTSPDQFEKLVIYEKEGYLVRLKDIGRAELSAKEDRAKSRFNGKPTVGIGIVKQSVANPITISKGLHEKLTELRKNLPTDTYIDVAFDRTIFIERSIDQVYSTIWEATILVVFVIFIFLGSLRASLVPLVTIPVSLIGAFIVVYMLGFTINTLTLLAMVLAIGLVVDDAIVVLENIHRYIEKGMKPFQAAIKGVTEISFAVVAMTLTLAAVYAPIALSSGMTGKLFTEFALTLAGAVIISGFIALTLSPMMCSLLLTHHQSKFVLWLEGYHKKIEDAYTSSLKIALLFRKQTILAGVAVALLGAVIGKFMPSELLPPEDQSVIYASTINAPVGATLDYIDRYVLQMEDIVKKVPELTDYFTLINLPTANARLVLKPWEERKRSAQQIADDLRFKLNPITGLSIMVNNPRSLGGAGGKEGGSASFVIQTSRTFEELNEIKERFTMALQKRKGVLNIQNNLVLDGQDYVVEIDRDRASALNVDVGTIGDTVEALVKGGRVSQFRRDGKEYDVRVQLEEHDRRNPSDLDNIFVRSERTNNNRNAPVMVPLSDMVTVKSRTAPLQLSHFNQQRAVTMTGELAPNANLGDVVKDIEEVAAEILPKGMKIDFAGETRRYIQESKSLIVIFGLALAFIYLVMAAQFESFVDPLIIMFSVPLSITGGLFLLVLAGGTFNLFSQIGFVTLIGLITKHGILIVDFANARREDGEDPFKAVLEASRQRLRPILMTTMAMVLGAIPLAIASGAGAESRQQIGLVIVGGMSFGTLFTLYVVPCVYTYLSRKRKVHEE